MIVGIMPDFYFYFYKIIGRLGLVNPSVTGYVRVKIRFEGVSWNLGFAQG